MLVLNSSTVPSMLVFMASNSSLCTEKEKQVMTLRISNECESGIEKSVLRGAVWHHEACRVMTNGDPEGGFCFFYLTGFFFLAYHHMNNGFIFLLTI